MSFINGKNKFDYCVECGEELLPSNRKRTNPKSCYKCRGIDIMPNHELNKVAKQGREATDLVTKQNLNKNFSLLTSVQSNIDAQVSGAVSEYARGMAVVRNISKLEGMDLTTQKEIGRAHV